MYSNQTMTQLRFLSALTAAGAALVLCACSSKQLYTVSKEAKRLDPGSFVVMLQANEVAGEGFRRLELGGPSDRDSK